MSANDERRRIHTFVVGASAGGIEALRLLVSALPADFPAALLVVLHLPPTGTSVLPQILGRAGPLEARSAEDDERIEGGHIYVAPPNRHLLVSDGHLRLDSGPLMSGHRPAVDALFRSAADAYGPSTAGVVLSGVLDDGTAGLRAITRAGGLGFVQDPAEALYDMMPRSAIEFGKPDRVATVQDLALAMAAVAVAPPDGEPPPPGAGAEAALLAIERGASDSPQPGEPSGLRCPDCGGVLWEERDGGGFVHFRCRIGHTYSFDGFAARHAESVEGALWVALLALEERAALYRRIAARQRDRGNDRLARRFALRADEAVEHALLLRDVVADLAAERGEPDEEGVA